MKLIFKSLKTHSAHSLALFIEMVIVTIVGWIVIEPVAVKTSIALIPSGYDADRLVSVSFQSLSFGSEEYDSVNKIDYKTRRNRMLEMIRERSEVEYATFTTSQCFESGSMGMSGAPIDSTYNLDKEKDHVSIIFAQFVPGTDFFSTFGIKSANGDSFEEPEIDSKSIIVSNTVAKAIYPNESAIGKLLYPHDPETSPIISGVTADASYRKGYGRIAVVFEPSFPDDEWFWITGITIRLKEGVSARQFINNLTRDIADYKVGNDYLMRPTPYTDLQTTSFARQSRELSQAWVILIFFLVNVILGVAGTFYIQSRSRASDAGVMRAFGATRSKIEWGIVAEACLTVILAWAAGSIIYLAYVHFAHVEFENEANLIVRILNPMWFDATWSRNAVVGGLVLLVLMACALLGSWLPARKIGNVPPVDALRDE